MQRHRQTINKCTCICRDTYMYINEKLFSMTLRVIHSFKLNNCYMREMFFMNNYHYVKTMSWLLCDTIYVHVISIGPWKKSLSRAYHYKWGSQDKASIVQGHLVSCSIILLLFIEAKEAANMYSVLSDNVSLYQRKW